MHIHRERDRDGEPTVYFQLVCLCFPHLPLGSSGQALRSVNLAWYQWHPMGPWVNLGFLCCDLMMTPPINDGYPLVNSLVDPENNQFLVGTSLPTPICQGPSRRSLRFCVYLYVINPMPSTIPKITPLDQMMGLSFLGLPHHQ